MQQHALTGVDLKEKLQRIIIELMDAGGTDGFWAAREFLKSQLDPTDQADLEDLVSNVEFERIQAIANEILESELPEMSIRFQKKFDEFNSEYFSMRLPAYTIKVLYDVGDFHPPVESDGIIDRHRKLIRLRVSESESLMVATLLHEMAHAATNGYHEIKWMSEMARLRDLGAPILEFELE